MKRRALPGEKFSLPLPQAGHLSRLGLSVLLLTALLAQGGCVAKRAAINTDDYVEIDNPFSNGAPDESPKIWVPKSSLENGAVRGGALVRKGYQAVVGKAGAGGASGSDTTALQGVRAPRPRLLVTEAKGGQLGGPLRLLLSRGCMVRPIATGEGVPHAEPERLAQLAALAAQPGGGPALLLAANGTGPGAQLKADLYDLRGPLLLRTFTITIPQPEKDEPAEEATGRALSGLSGAILEVLSGVPWYGRVVSVSGERIYLDAGAESGLKPGQTLIVRRGGEAVNGVGFASGQRITSFAVAGLVGPDGAYGISPEAASVLPGDLVELPN